MTRYRFVTPHRTGKWYPDLETAQRHACEIGAGFLDEKSGAFVAYVDTVLEQQADAQPGLVAPTTPLPAAADLAA